MYKDLPIKLIDSVLDKNLSDISADFIELGIDSFLDDGLIKDIPIIGNLVKLSNAVIDIRDRIFLAKIARFLFSLSDFSEEDRKRFHDRIFNNRDFSKRVGNTILIIIDRIDSLDKSKMLAKVFRYYLLEEINFDYFRRLAHAIENSFLDDLYRIINNDIDDELLNNLLPSGLTKFSVGRNWENVGEVSFEVSELGRVFVKYVSS